MSLEQLDQAVADASAARSRWLAADAARRGAECKSLALSIGSPSTPIKGSKRCHSPGPTFVDEVLSVEESPVHPGCRIVGASRGAYDKVRAAPVACAPSPYVRESAASKSGDASSGNHAVDSCAASKPLALFPEAPHQGEERLAIENPLTSRV